MMMCAALPSHTLLSLIGQSQKFDTTVGYSAGPRPHMIQRLHWPVPESWAPSYAPASCQGCRRPLHFHSVVPGSYYIAQPKAPTRTEWGGATEAVPFSRADPVGLPDLNGMSQNPGGISRPSEGRATESLHTPRAGSRLTYSLCRFIIKSPLLALCRMFGSYLLCQGSLSPPRSHAHHGRAHRQYHSFAGGMSTNICLTVVAHYSTKGG